MYQDLETRMDLLRVEISAVNSQIMAYSKRLTSDVDWSNLEDHRDLLVAQYFTLEAQAGQKYQGDWDIGCEDYISTVFDERSAARRELRQRKIKIRASVYYDTARPIKSPECGNTQGSMKNVPHELNNYSPAI